MQDPEGGLTQFCIAEPSLADAHRQADGEYLDDTTGIGVTVN